MRLFPICAAVIVLLVTPPAFAQGSVAPAAATATPILKTGSAVRTADNHLLGHIEEIQTASGQPVSVSLIYDEHFIHIPVSTLSAGKGDALVTSLSFKDIGRLQ